MATVAVRQGGPEPRRSISLGRRGSSPASEARRAAAATGRALIGPRSSSKEQAPSSVPTQQRLQGPRSSSKEQTSSSAPTQQRLPRQGPAVPSHPTAEQHQHAIASGAGDSLSDLLHKPLLPQNAAMYNRLADQLMDPRQGRASAKPPRAGPVAARRTADFDEEARKLWARLNLDPEKDTRGEGVHQSLDALWRHPKTGGTFYVGNEVAARTMSLLNSYNITHVVNCTDSIPNYHEKSPGAPFTYLRFDITSHYQRARTEKEATTFVKPMLEFVSDALSKGKNVMVHCLAGAHRAGTTGIICLMHFAKLGAKDATFTAKQLRPIIDPICDFPLLLARLEKAWQQQPHPERHNQ